MKRILIMVMTLALAAMLTAMVGCGGDDTTTVKTSDGEATSTGESRTSEVDSEEGVDMEDSSSKAVKEAPVYSGAEYLKGGLEESSEPGVMSTSAIWYTTGDGYEEVVGWYEDELGEPTEVKTDPYEATTWENITKRESGSNEPELSVTVRNESEGVMIIIDQITY